MIPVCQTRDGEGGNCFQAAIASLFELSLDDVPDFVNLYPDTNDFSRETKNWFQDRGLYMLTTWFDNGADINNIDGYYLMVGNGPRGVLHNVIGRAGQMVFDPHPSGEGLLEVDHYNFFIVLDDFNR